MKTSQNYLLTFRACEMSYFVQGILNNFLPLLFVRFRTEFDLTLEEISFLIMVNFAVQMIVDYLSAKLVDFVGYRQSAIASHLFSAIGLAGIAFIPDTMPNPYIGIIICIVVYAIGSGLIETVGSPIVEACPIDNKKARMSMLHSFYCWGHVATVILSSVFFVFVGIDNWRLLSVLWAVIPFAIMFIFFKVPIISLKEQGKNMKGRKMIRIKAFWILVVLMFCSGASELGISQWISTFAESGLGLNKTIGDLTGACMFAILMGASRVFYGKLGHKIDLHKYMFISAVACFVCYITAALAPWPIISLIACILCGTTVGIMWPGVYAIATSVIKTGGTGLFAYLALAGDLGCAGGPGIMGIISQMFGDDLRIGILTASAFPAVFILFFVKLLKISQTSRKNEASD